MTGLAAKPGCDLSGFMPGTKGQFSKLGVLLSEVELCSLNL